MLQALVRGAPQKFIKRSSTTSPLHHVSQLGLCITKHSERLMQVNRALPSTIATAAERLLAAASP